MLVRVLQNSRFFTTKCTVDPKQTLIFNELSKAAWDLEKSFKLLHAMNIFRVPWIQNRLIEIGTVKPEENNFSLKGLSILDVGCGIGLLSESLSHLGGNLTGLDCNAQMLDAAKSHALCEGISNIQYVHSTIEEHVLENTNKYDVVVASETIEHVHSQDFFLKCCVGCLKPGGSIFLTTNSKSKISKFIFITLFEDILRTIPKGTHEYDMFIDVEDVRDLLKKENCKTVFTRGLVYNPLIGKWVMIKNHHVMHYTLHAVKEL